MTKTGSFWTLRKRKEPPARYRQVLAHGRGCPTYNSTSFHTEQTRPELAKIGETLVYSHTGKAIRPIEGHHDRHRDFHFIVRALAYKSLLRPNWVEPNQNAEGTRDRRRGKRVEGAIDGGHHPHHKPLQAKRFCWGRPSRRTSAVDPPPGAVLVLAARI